MKIFISQPMKDKTNEEIIAERKKAILKVKEIVNDKVEIIDSYMINAPYNANPLWFLGSSLKFLSSADIICFTSGWENARGCKIEHICAEEYGFKIIELD